MAADARKFPHIVTLRWEDMKPAQPSYGPGEWCDHAGPTRSFSTRRTCCNL